VCLNGLLYNFGGRTERFRGKVITSALKLTHKKTV
jgi:hypothetical protein